MDNYITRLNANEWAGSHGDRIMLEMHWIAWVLACYPIQRVRITKCYEVCLLRCAQISLVFRVMFGCGIAKLNESWISCASTHCELGAMPFHYKTQEMPSIAAYYLFKYMPMSFHKFTTITTLLVETVGAFFLLFGTSLQLRCICMLNMLLMLAIVGTGTFGVFPVTIFCVSLSLYNYIEPRGGDTDNVEREFDQPSIEFSSKLSSRSIDKSWRGMAWGFISSVFCILICFIGASHILQRFDILGESYYISLISMTFTRIHISSMYSQSSSPNT